MKITLISAGWPPAFGGGEIHSYRVLERLQKAGIESNAIVKQQSKEGMWNGDFDDDLVHRISVEEQYFPSGWLSLVKERLEERGGS